MRNLSDYDAADILDRAVLDDGVTVAVFNYEHFKGAYPRNLVAFSRDGNFLWDSAPTQPQSAFTSIVTGNPELLVREFAGFICKIDPLSGEVLSTVFSK